MLYLHRSAPPRIGSVHFQAQVSLEISAQLQELKAQISKEYVDRDETLAQARTTDKATLDRALRLALDSLRQAKQDKDAELQNARRQHAYAQEELEQAQKELSLVRVDIRKHEKLGFKRSMEHTHILVAQVMRAFRMLSQAHARGFSCLYFPQERSQHLIVRTDIGYCVRYSVIVDIFSLSASD